MSATTIDGIYRLKKLVGKGGMAKVYLADVDLDKFDYTTLYAYTQVKDAANHRERLRKSVLMVNSLKDGQLDSGTVRAILEAQEVPVPSKSVALKVARDDSGSERFESEWQSLICLSHENVVKVYGGGVFQGRPYYAMELMEKIVSPKEVLKSFSLAQKLEAIIQGGRGLSYLHQNGIIHRDVKPDNMVTCTVNGKYVTKVTDLGLAKQTENEMGMTNTTAVLGTPQYAAPEQLKSAKHVDARCDVYALGASLYEYMTQKRPYHTKSSVYEVIAAVGTGEAPISPDKHSANMPEHLINILNTAMSADLNRRYQSTEEMLRDLESFYEAEQSALENSLTFDTFRGRGVELVDTEYSKYIKTTSKKKKGRKTASKPAGKRASAPASQTRKKSGTKTSKSILPRKSSSQKRPKQASRSANKSKHPGNRASRVTRRRSSSSRAKGRSSIPVLLTVFSLALAGGLMFLRLQQGPAQAADPEPAPITGLAEPRIERPSTRRTNAGRDGPSTEASSVERAPSYTNPFDDTEEPSDMSSPVYQRLSDAPKEANLYQNVFSKEYIDVNKVPAFVRSRYTKNRAFRKVSRRQN